METTPAHDRRLRLNLTARRADVTSPCPRRRTIIGINNHDLSEVVTLHVDHPDDAPQLSGRQFITPWFTMDPSRSDLFEESTYLKEYPHPYGGGAAYGDDLVEGYHLLGMLDFLFNHSLWSDGPWIAWNYGLDAVRFVTVIRTTDEFRLRGTITDVVERPGKGFLLVIDVIGEVKGRERPGFVATQRLLWSVG